MTRLLAGVLVGVVALVAAYVWLVVRPVRVQLAPGHRRALDEDWWTG